MLAAMCTAFLGFLGILPATMCDGNNLTFWMETLSIEAFGVAWTVKGELVLADKNTQLFLPLVSPYIFM